MQNVTLDPMLLFMQAGLIVKAVIILLLLLSLWCWTVVFACGFRLTRLQTALARAKREQSSAPFQTIFDAGIAEARQRFNGETYEGRRARVITAMRRRVQETIEGAQGGLVNLAAISSVAPFIGLFGTVWGIMSSFVSITAAKDTSLAVVAPGIAEALAATAIGLVAAIPAAFAYNRFVASFTRAGRTLTRLVEDNADRVLQTEPGHLRDAAQGGVR